MKLKKNSFAELDSLLKVEGAVAAGTLEKLLLLPAEFGGKDIPENVVCVPIGIVGIKKNVDAEALLLLQKGLISRYTAAPEYSGKSFVPIRIRIKAWSPQKEEQLEETIEVWDG